MNDLPHRSRIAAAPKAKPGARVGRPEDDESVRRTAAVADGVSAKNTAPGVSKRLKRLIYSRSFFEWTSPVVSCGAPKSQVKMWAEMWTESWAEGLRPVGKLTTKGLASLRAPGRYGDGDGLWFQIRRPDPGRKTPEGPPARSWILRYTWQGRPRQFGLGPYPDVGLADARVAAAAARKSVRDGVDPVDARKVRRKADKAARTAETPRLTFEDAGAAFIAANEIGWRNPKHRQQWRNTLETYAYPILGAMAAADVDTEAVMRAIEPIWQAKPETASRLRGRIETILDYAKARGWRHGENPARWRGHIANMLPKRSKVARVEHHPALPWAEVAAFMTSLRTVEGEGARALELTVLTAARTGEVIGARWSEIDIARAVWTVPASRMKAGREHRVPLSAQALAILQAPTRDPADASSYVFRGRKDGRGLSDMTLTAVLRRLGRGDLTVHGFRSTFRDWCAEATATPRELAEAALAHTVRDRVEAAYQRGDLFDKRRQLMAAWATFCGGKPAENGGVNE